MTPTTKPQTLTFADALGNYIAAIRRVVSGEPVQVAVDAIVALKDAHEAAITAAVEAAYIKGHESGFYRGNAHHDPQVWLRASAASDYVSDGMPTSQPTNPEDQ